MADLVNLKKGVKEVEGGGVTGWWWLVEGRRGGGCGAPRPAALPVFLRVFRCLQVFLSGRLTLPLTRFGDPGGTLLLVVVVVVVVTGN